jgi:FkbM family methyltransferase
MKKVLKKFLQRKGWYEYFKYSFLFSFYQFLFKPGEIRNQKKEIYFYRSFLNDCDLIFDIGANDGHKTAAFLSLSNKVVCCEPDARSFQTLQIRFRNKKKRVFIENKALADQEGAEEFYIHHEGSAFNTLNERWKDILEKDQLQKWNEKIIFNDTPVEVTTTTLDILIEKYGLPEFIKIDVEGYEEQVLKGLSQKVPFISFECLLPDFKSEILSCINRLEQLSSHSSYNIAQGETLVFKKFLSKQQLLEWIDSTTTSYFEIVTKMNGETS